MDSPEQSVLLADGFEDALIGVSEQFNGPPIAVYDRGKCIEILISRDGMSRESAEEFFSYNVQGAWVGDQTPAFLISMEEFYEQIQQAD